MFKQLCLYILLSAVIWPKQCTRHKNGPVIKTTRDCAKTLVLKCNFSINKHGGQWRRGNAHNNGLQRKRERKRGWMKSWRWCEQGFYTLQCLSEVNKTHECHMCFCKFWCISGHLRPSQASLFLDKDYILFEAAWLHKLLKIFSICECFLLGFSPLKDFWWQIFNMLDVFVLFFLADLIILNASPSDQESVGFTYDCWEGWALSVSPVSQGKQTNETSGKRKNPEEMLSRKKLDFCYGFVVLFLGFFGVLLQSHV